MASARELINKTRKFLHRFAPRELSPTRMAEKYGADQKKKGAAKVAAVATSSATKNAEADAMLAAQMEAIRAALPVELPPQLAAALPPTAGARANVSQAPVRRTNYVPYVVGGTLALGALVLLMRNRK